MKNAVTAVVALVALGATAGAGYAWTLHEAQATLDRAVAQVRAGLGPRGSLSYASSTVHPFQRAADLTQVAMRTSDGELLTLDEMKVAVGGTGKIAELHATGLRFAGPGGDGVLTAESLDGTDVTFPPPVPGQPFTMDPAAVTFSDLTVRSLTFAQTGKSVRLASLAVSNYGAGRASRVKLSDVSVPIPNVEHVDHAGFAAFDLTGVDLAMVASAIQHQTIPRQLSPGAVRLEISDLHAGSGTARPLAMQRLLVTADNDPDGGGSTGRIEIAGVAIEPTDEAGMARFAAVGLTRVRGGLTQTTSYRMVGGLFETSPVIEVEGWGKLALNLKLAHLDAGGLEAPNADPTALLTSVGSAQLVSAMARFTDAGLLEFALSQGGWTTGLGKDGLRNQVVQIVSSEPSFAALPQGEQMRAAVVAFLQRGGQIAIKVQPSPPLTLNALEQSGTREPAALIQHLGLSVSDG